MFRAYPDMWQYILINVGDVGEYSEKLSLNVPDILVYIPDIQGDVPDISRMPILPVFKPKQGFFDELAY